MTSSITDGGGNLKASKPGKKRKMLSATCWVWSACPIPWFLPVGLKSSCNKEPVIFFWGGSRGLYSGRKMVFSGERRGDQSLPTEYEGDTMDN